MGKQEFLKRVKTKNLREKGALKWSERERLVSPIRTEQKKSHAFPTGLERGS